MSEYLIAVKRHKRDSAPPNWEEMLSDIQGLILKNAGRSRRVRVDATPEAIDEARKRLSDSCHIEPVMHHHPV
ncbi:MAG: hypothetical protein O7I42_16435 [Alphaproteobacteria bacterium]|nr:hypothetical protein [Alphaproteobacteria bacterium]